MRPGQTDDDGASIGWKGSVGRADVTHLNGAQGESTSVSEDPQGAPRGTGRWGTVYIRATGSDGEQGGREADFDIGTVELPSKSQGGVGAGEGKKKKRKAVSSDKEFDEKTVRSFNN